MLQAGTCGVLVMKQRSGDSGFPAVCLFLRVTILLIVHQGRFLCQCERAAEIKVTAGDQGFPK